MKNFFHNNGQFITGLLITIFTMPFWMISLPILLLVSLIFKKYKLLYGAGIGMVIALVFAIILMALAGP